MPKTQSHGFTLVAIMVTVAILALLANLVVPNMMRGRTAANDTSAKTTLKTISTAVENNMAISGQYPDRTDALMIDPPHSLNKDYFSAPHNGFQFVADSLGAGGDPSPPSG